MQRGGVIICRIIFNDPVGADSASPMGSTGATVSRSFMCSRVRMCACVCASVLVCALREMMMIAITASMRSKDPFGSRKQYRR